MSQKNLTRIIKLYISAKKQLGVYFSLKLHDKYIIKRPGHADKSPKKFTEKFTKVINSKPIIFEIEDFFTKNSKRTRVKRHMRRNTREGFYEMVKDGYFKKAGFKKVKIKVGKLEYSDTIKVIDPDAPNKTELLILKDKSTL